MTFCSALCPGVLFYFFFVFQGSVADSKWVWHRERYLKYHYRFGNRRLHTERNLALKDEHFFDVKSIERSLHRALSPLKKRIISRGLFCGAETLGVVWFPNRTSSWSLGHG